MLPRRDTLNLELVVPDNSSDIGVTPGVSWAWGSWTQMTAGLSFPFLLTHVAMQLGFSGSGIISAYEPLQMQVGQGASGSETVINEIGTAMYCALSGTSPTAKAGPSFNFPVAPTIIPANTRLALRATEKSATQYLSPYCYLYGYNANNYSLPLYFKSLKEIEQLLKGLRTKVARVYPSAGLSSALTPGSTIWTWGSWTQIIASTSLSMLMTGIVVTPQAVPRSGQVEIGVGASGSEQAMSNVAVPGYFGGGSGTYYLLRPFLVYKGERVSARCKWGQTTSGPYINLLYYELT
jgi:hypothetical protein